MSTFIFLRHGHSSANKSGTLTGQLPGVGLSSEGERQAGELVERIGPGIVEYVHLSPIARCQLTLDPWLNSRHSSSMKQLAVDDGFAEIDFGNWSGRKLSSLRRDPLWKSVQNTPSKVTFPGGESFKSAQRRAYSSFNDLRVKRGNHIHLIVSHSDTIKLLIAAILDIHLDNFQRITIDPASFTIVKADGKGSSLVAVNTFSPLKELIR